jgi:hypothetical protein
VNPALPAAGAGSPLERRRRATQRTLDKFRGKPFSWQRATTCIHVTQFHLRAMGMKVQPVPRVRGPVAARRAMEARGWRDVGDLLAATGLARIPAAMMLLGDLASFPSSDGMGGILICAGPQKLMGWREDHLHSFTMLDVSLDEIGEAWRVGGA